MHVCLHKHLDNRNGFTRNEWDQQSMCIRSDATGTLSPPPSLSSLSLILSSSPALRLLHGFLCHPLPHRNKRREACSFMHSASQLRTKKKTRPLLSLFLIIFLFVSSSSSLCPSLSPLSTSHPLPVLTVWVTDSSLDALRKRNVT